MKKFIALLLAAVISVAAAVPTFAAEDIDETAPDAPVFVGVQKRAADKDGCSDIRFIATVSSLKGTGVGYEIVAEYYSEGAEEPWRSTSYTAAETESSKVYTSVMVNGKVKSAGELTDGAAALYVTTVTDVPNAQSVDFTVTAYVRHNGELIRSVPKTMRWENGVPMEYDVAYSQSFDTAYDAAANLKAVGVTPKYTAKTAGGVYTVDNGRLNVKYPDWSYCMSALADGGKMNELVGEGDAYLYEMDMNVDRINVLGLYMNGECQYNDKGTEMGYKDDAKNGFFVAIRWFTDAGTASATDISGGEKLYFRFGWIDGSGNGTPSGNKDSNTIEDMLIKYDRAGTTVIPQNTDILSIKLGVAVHKLATGCRVDLYVNDVYQTSYTTPENTHWVKENSFPLLWAQTSTLAIDNIKFGNITNSATQPTENSSTPAINGSYYEEDFENTENYLDKVGVSVPFVSVPDCKSGGLPVDIVNNKLSVSKHAWHNSPDYYATVVEAGRIKDGQTYYFETEFSEISSTGPMGVMLVNNGKLTSETELQKNGFFVRFMVSDSALTGVIRVTNYDASGTAVKYGGNTYRDVSASSIKSGDTAVKLGIRVDSTPANGTIISIYANDTFVTSLYTDGNGYDAGTDTSIALWAQSSSFKLDNILLKVYNTPTEA